MTQQTPYRRAVERQMLSMFLLFSEEVIKCYKRNPIVTLGPSESVVPFCHSVASFVQRIGEMGGRVQ